MADFFFGLPVVLQALLKGLAVIAVVFPVAAACSMAERKVCAWIQGRPGPNRAVPPFLAWIPGIGIPQRLGLFQLAADGGKFLFKEEPLPDHVHKLYYTLAPSSLWCRPSRRSRSCRSARTLRPGGRSCLSCWQT